MGANERQQDLGATGPTAPPTRRMTRSRPGMNDLDTSIPDWIIDYPQTAKVFDALRIDASCQGKSLEYVCQQHGLVPERVLQRLLQAIDDKDGRV